MLGAVTVVLDNAIGNVALPTIRPDLGFDEGSFSTSFPRDALRFGGPLILADRGGDVFGRRRLLVAAIAVFGGASLLCAWAPRRGCSPPGRAGRRRFEGDRGRRTLFAPR